MKSPPARPQRQKNLAFLLETGFQSQSSLCSQRFRLCFCCDFCLLLLLVIGLSENHTPANPKLSSTHLTKRTSASIHKSSIQPASQSQIPLRFHLLSGSPIPKLFYLWMPSNGQPANLRWYFRMNWLTFKGQTSFGIGWDRLRVAWPGSIRWFGCLPVAPSQNVNAHATIE